MILILSFYLLFIVFAEEDIPVGMKKLRVGSAAVIVPKDANINKDDNLIVLEGVNTYIARKLNIMEERITEAKLKQEELQRDIEKVKKIISIMQEKK
jgi:intein/homing endonuclease